MADIHVRYAVRASFSKTLGLNTETDELVGDRLREVLAENLDQMIEDAGGIYDFIDSVTIEEVADDSDRTITTRDGFR